MLNQSKNSTVDYHSGITFSVVSFLSGLDSEGSEMMTIHESKKLLSTYIKFKV